MDQAHGQGASEYLILLGVVLIVAIATISLLGFFPGLTGDASISESQLYWRGSAKPISVYDVKNTGPVCGALGYGYTMVLTNSDPDSVDITTVLINGTSTAFCETGGSAAASSIAAGPGQTVKIDVVGSSCTVDRTVELDLAFRYNTPYLDDKKEAGAKKLAFKCSS